MLALNKRRIIKIGIIIVLLISVFHFKVFAIVSPTANFYVNDYANLLNSDTENYIIHMNQQLCNKTGAQIVVVTVPNLEEDSLEEYATKLFRKFGIGDKDKNNGVLLLLALEERQFRVEVGYGLEGVLNDAKTGRIQDEYIIPYLKNNQWDQGVQNGFNAILQEVSDEYGINIENAEEAKVNSHTTNKEFRNLFVVAIISGIFGFLTVNVNKKFAIIYIVLFIASSICMRICGNKDFLFEISSLMGFFYGIIGFISTGSSSSGGSSFGRW